MRRESNKTALGLAGLFVLALAARVLPFLDVATDTIGIPIGYVDSLYHLRRVELLLMGGHWAPPFDTYSTFPTGGDFFWPPLFDYLLAAITWVAALGHPTRETLHWVGATVPPILGALIVLPVYGFGKWIGGRAAGFVAAAAIAVIPIHGIYTAFGRADHHGAETLLLTLHFLLFVATVRAATRSSAAGLPRGRIALCALFGFATVSVQMGAILLIGLVSLFVLVRFASDLGSGRDPRPALVAAFLPQVFAAALLGLFTLLWGGHRRLEFAYNQPSLFQPTLYILFALFPLFLLGAARVSRRVSKPFRIPGILLAGATLFLALPIAAIPGLGGAILDSLGWIGNKEAYLPTVLETQPLFSREGAFTIRPVLSYLRLFFPAGILGLAFLVRAGRSFPSADPATRTFLIVWTTSLLLLAINQVRFVSFLSINLAILTGLLCAPFLASPNRVRKSLGWAMVAVLILSSGVLEFGTRGRAYHRLDPAVVDACAWLDRNTPETDHYLNPTEAPEYGVACHPGHGHHVAYLGRRPASCNPFFDLEGLRRTSECFLAQGEEEAIAALKRIRCRYLLLDAGCMGMTAYSQLLDSEIRKEWSDPRRKASLLAPTPCISLYHTDGNSSEVIVENRQIWIENEYDHFRLVYESHATDGGNRVKIFEPVAAATVTGTAPRRTTVRISVPVTTSSGRRFDFVREAVIGRDQRFRFAVPYSTPQEPAVVSIRSQDGSREISTLQVVIPEEAVRNGETVDPR